MATDIPTGRQVATDELPVHPIDASSSPATLPPAVRVPVADGPASAGPLLGSVMPTTEMFQSQMAAGEADVRSAQTAGQDARNALLGHYEASVMPLGGIPGDNMAPLPPVPAAAVPPAMSDLYPYSGTEPTPAAAGFAGEYGGA